MKVLLFSNDSCGSCRKWKPTFLKLMNQFNLEFDVIDNFKDKDKAKQYNVTGIPCTIFLNNRGIELGHILGSMIEELAIRDIQYYIKKDGEARDSGLQPA